MIPMEPASLLMERRMLYGIKQRAENLAKQADRHMRIWTISAAAGTGGERIAADLAEAAGVPLLDFKALSSYAGDQLGDVPDLAHLEERVGGRLNAIGLSLAMIGSGSALAVSEVPVSANAPGTRPRGAGGGRALVLRDSSPRVRFLVCATTFRRSMYASTLRWNGASTPTNATTSWIAPPLSAPSSTTTT